MVNAALHDASDGAKLLYTVLLDRMGLSALNDWRDMVGDVYIYYSNKELCEALNWSHDKVTKKLKELEGMGLIRRRKQKMGQPDAIYVLPFLPLCELSALQSTGNQDYGVQEVSNMEGGFSASNKTENINNEFNKNNLSIGGYDEMLQQIKENIEYEILSERHIRKEELDNIVTLMADVCCGTNPVVRIGGSDYSREVVKSRFLSLNSMHIEYVMGVLEHTTTDISNIRAYLISALFNAPATMEYFYGQRALHVMANMDLK